MYWKLQDSLIRGARVDPKTSGISGHGESGVENSGCKQANYLCVGGNIGSICLGDEIQSSVF